MATIEQVIAQSRHDTMLDDWAAKLKRKEAVEKKLRKVAAHVRKPAEGETITVSAHGKSATLKGLRNRDFFLEIVGDLHARFGTWPQIQADVGHFLEEGTLPVSEGKHW